MPASVSFNDIMRTTNRLAFSKRDLQHLNQYLQTAQKNGMDITVHERMRSEGKAGILEWFENGILALSCPQIESDILFAKIFDGRGLFGGEKARFMNYLGDMNADEFMVGSSHKMLVMGLTGINNIFRGNGLLKGAAL